MKNIKLFQRIKKNNKFICPICKHFHGKQVAFNNGEKSLEGLIKHVEITHLENYKDIEKKQGYELSPEQLLKAFIDGNWIIKGGKKIFSPKWSNTCRLPSCNRDTKFNKDTYKYNFYCTKEHAIEFNKNMKKTRVEQGTDKDLSDPIEQRKMLKSKSEKNNWFYEFNNFKDSNGNILKMAYLSEPERNFLEYLDMYKKIDPSNNLLDPYDLGIIIEYEFQNVNGKKQKSFYIPDFFIPEYDLIIEIKNRNDNPAFKNDTKLKEPYKQAAAYKYALDNKKHYIYVFNGDFKQLDSTIEWLETFRRNNLKTTEEKIEIPTIFLANL